ncbi:MAG: YdcF family protein [Candidatus Hydrogenedentes bacterium]|nr:YdcF family protein [Candidatus Hydrogenedentota bacterium]
MSARTKKILIIGALSVVALFLATEFSIIYDGFTDEVASSDVALILGNKVNPDGSLSKRLRGRLDKGLSLYQQGLVPKLIVSGGLGNEGHLEGDAMAAYLVEKGILAEDIIIDNEGVNTLATARNYARLREEHGFDSVIIVSQFFHISRTRLVLKKVGANNIGAAHSTIYEWRDIYSTIREFAGYYKYLLLY